MQNIKQILTRLIETLYRSRKVLLALSCLVVFVVTYILILPAFTLEKDEAAELGGIDVPGVEQTEDSSVSSEDDGDLVEESDAIKPEAKPDSVAKKSKSSVKKAVITADEDNYEITVSYGEDAMIPDDAELVVKEISNEDSKYSELCTNAIEELSKTGDVLAEPLAVSISIISNGKEIEPAEGSRVDVDIKLVKSALNGEFTGDESSILVNEAPLAEANAEIKQEFQVVHEMNNGDIEIVETDNNIDDEEIQSSFTTESFSDWLLFLDETVENITIGVNDTITLRPYSKWVWKKNAEEEQYQNYEWKVPTSSNVISFTKANKNDNQLDELYTYYHGQASRTGTFDLQLTDNENVVHTIHVTVVDDVPDIPQTVQGTDEITVNLFDYDINPSNPNKSGTLDQEANVASSSSFRNTSINRYSDLQFLGYGGSNTNSEWFSINNYTKAVPNQGIIKPRLVNGYPQLGPSTNGKSRSHPDLKYLFDVSTEVTQPNDMVAYPNVTGLFQKENGYYYYNSNSNYAYYDSSNNSMILYDHTYSQWTSGSAGANAKPIGFFPFHQYDSYLKEGNTGMNFNTNLNHHFGMSMTVDFEIPSDGLDDYGNPITFEFSGDDDMWVFIDDNLVLDVGGIHQPVTGSINFSANKVSVYGEDDTTITQRFLDAGSPTAWETGDGKPHTMKVFYLERGGCDSNLSLKFNTPKRFGKGKLSLVKRELGKTTPLPKAKFRIWNNAKCEGEPLGEYVSDGNGNINFGEFVLNSKTDTLYMKEVESPDGYIRDTSVYQIKPRLNNQGEAVRDSDGYIVLDVVNKDGTALEKLDNGAVVFPNDKKGKINIPAEKKWAGDENDDTVVTLTIKRYKLIDKTKGFMIIKDLSGEPEGYAFDADYVITYPDGHKVVVPYRDFNEGVYSLVDPEPGEYVIEETIKSSTPEGYSMSHAPQPQRVAVELEEDGTALAEFKTTFSRDTGILHIKQNLTVNNGSVSYNKVRYAVLDENGKKVTSITYAEAAQGKDLELPTGNYTVKAVSVPKTVSPMKLDSQNTEYNNVTESGVVRDNISVSKNQTSNVTFNSIYTKQNSAQNCTYRIGEIYNGNTVFASGKVDFPSGTRVQMSFQVPQNSTWPNDVQISYNNTTLTGYTSNVQNNLQYTVEFVVQDNHQLNIKLNANKDYNNHNWESGIHNNLIGPTFEVVANTNSLNALRRALLKNDPDTAANDNERLLAASDSNTAKHPDAPAGKKYIKDNEWSQEVILESSNNWRDATTLTNLPACDEEGNKYYYYVASVNEQGVAEGTVCTIDLEDGKQLLIGEDKNRDASLSVTNNETTSIDARKVWADVSPADHPTSVKFKIYQIGYYTDNEQQKIYQEGWYEDKEYTINGNETVTVSGLPKTEIKDVLINGNTVSKSIHYEYQVVEIPVEGYMAEYNVVGNSYTITNTPIEEPEHTTQLELQKFWKDHEGEDASVRHASDKIEFKLIQKAIKAEDIVPVTVIYSAKGQEPIQTEMFVSKGSRLKFTFLKGETILPHYVDFNGAGINEQIGGRGTTFTQDVIINEPTTIKAELTWWYFRLPFGPTYYDRWGDTVEDLDRAYQWIHAVEATSGTLYENYDSMYAAVHGGEEDSSSIFTYTMDRTSAPLSDLDTEPFTVANDGDWKAKFTELPQFQKVGDDYYIYDYEISEFKIITGEGENERIENVGSTTEEGFNGETTNFFVKWNEDPDGSWTITNQEKPARVEFIKKWIDGAGQQTVWPDGLSIEVTVKGETESDSKTYVYSIDKEHVTAGEITATSPASAPKLKVESTDNNNYKFVIESVDKFDSQGAEYEYTIRETSHPDGYQEPHYVLASGEDAGKGRTSTDNGGSIENAVTTYELPHTGGIGTTLFYILGSMLAVGCAAVLITRRRFRRG